MGKSVGVNGLYRTIYVKLWDDNKVSKMSLEEKCVFIYLMTSPQSNLASCYQLNMGLASKQLGITERKFMSLLFSLRDKRQMIDYDDETEEVLVCNRGKYSWSKSQLPRIWEECKNTKNPYMKRYIRFLTSHSYCESNWDSDVCSYYDGKWKELPEVEEVSESVKKPSTEVESTEEKKKEVSDTTKNVKFFFEYIDGINKSEAIKSALKEYYQTVQSKKAFTLKQVKLQLEVLNGIDDTTALNAIRQSLANNYAGFFPKQRQRGNQINKVPVQNVYTSHKEELGNYEEY